MYSVKVIVFGVLVGRKIIFGDIWLQKKLTQLLSVVLLLVSKQSCCRTQQLSFVLLLVNSTLADYMSDYSRLVRDLLGKTSLF